MSNGNGAVLDADLQEIAARVTWLGKLPKWCVWEHLLHDDVMALVNTVQAQRVKLGEYRDSLYGDEPNVPGPGEKGNAARPWNVTLRSASEIVPGSGPRIWDEDGLNDMFGVDA